jgi:hypothetical protein
LPTATQDVLHLETLTRKLAQSNHLREPETMSSEQQLIGKTLKCTVHISNYVNLCSVLIEFGAGFLLCKPAYESDYQNIFCNIIANAMFSRVL